MLREKLLAQRGTPTVQPTGQRERIPARNAQAPSQPGPSYPAVPAPAPVQRPSFTGGGSTNVNVQPFNYDEFRDFGDSVMQEYERSTEPEIEQRRARMNQDLVNKGLTPGSEAYEREMDRFMRMENDLFQTAQRGALEQGLMAQNQAFTQGLGQANINAGLNTAKMGADASMYGADVGRAGSLERLLAGLSQQESEFGRGLEQRESEFGRNFGLQSGQADFGNLMELLGYGTTVANSNNQALANDRQYSSGLVGGFMPNAPFVPINAGGAYGTTLDAQNARANLQSRNHDSLMSGIGSLGGSLIPFLPF